MTKVLVVDDERDGADGMAMFLQSLGHETETASNGLEALAVSARFKPDVVILDIEMPLMDGFQAARCLRDRSNGAHQILVAVTAIACEDAGARTKASGFDFYMSKPADLAKVGTLVERVRDPPPKA